MNLSGSFADFAIAVFLVTVASIAIMHLKMVVWTKRRLKKRIDFRDPTYWALVAAFCFFIAFTAVEWGRSDWQWRTPLTFAGVVLSFGGLGLAIRAQKVLGDNYSPTVSSNNPGGALVTTGPYKYFKHPIYVGNTILMIGLLFIAHSIAAWIALAPYLAALAWRIKVENRFIEKLSSGGQNGN